MTGPVPALLALCREIEALGDDACLDSLGPIGSPMAAYETWGVRAFPAVDALVRHRLPKVLGELVAERDRLRAPEPGPETYEAGIRILRAVIGHLDILRAVSDPLEKFRAHRAQAELLIGFMRASVSEWRDRDRFLRRKHGGLDGR